MVRPFTVRAAPTRTDASGDVMSNVTLSALPRAAALRAIIDASNGADAGSARTDIGVSSIVPMPPDRTWESGVAGPGE